MKKLRLSFQIILKAFDGGGLSSQALIIVYAMPDNFQELAILSQKKGSIERDQIAGLPNFLVTKSPIATTSGNRQT